MVGSAPRLHRLHAAAVGLAMLPHGWIDVPGHLARLGGLLPAWPERHLCTTAVRSGDRRWSSLADERRRPCQRRRRCGNRVCDDTDHRCGCFSGGATGKGWRQWRRARSIDSTLERLSGCDCEMALTAGSIASSSRPRSRSHRYRSGHVRNAPDGQCRTVRRITRSHRQSRECSDSATNAVAGGGVRNVRARRATSICRRHDVDRPRRSRR